MNAGQVKDAIPAEIGRCRVIQLAIAAEFKVAMADLMSQRRDQRCARPRQIGMYLARRLTPYSLPRIGEQFGGRDHTTVLHAIQAVKDWMDEDPAMAARVQRLERDLRNSGALEIEPVVDGVIAGVDGQLRRLFEQALALDPVATAQAVVAALKKVAGAAAFALWVSAAFALWASAAGAQEPGEGCGPRAELLAKLADRYGETPAAGGLNSRGFLVTLVRREDGASWSIVATTPQGWSCLLDAGEGWQELPRPQKGDPS